MPSIQHAIERPNDFIANNIARMRKAKKMSQADVAARLQIMGINYTRGRLSMIENRQRPAPHLLLVGLKIIFDCDYADFYRDLEQYVREEK